MKDRQPPLRPARLRPARAAAFSAVLAGAAALAAWSTGGQTAVPAPPSGQLAALAAAVGVVAAARGPRWLLAAALLALGLAGAQDFLRPGLSYGHDLRHHLWGIWST